MVKFVKSCLLSLVRLTPALGWTRLTFVSGVLGVAGAASLRASSPALNVILPRGVQRGQTHTLTFNGAQLADAQEALLYFDGVVVEKIEPVDANNVKVVVVVTPDCRLGEHMAQIRTASGISDFRSFYVGALPQVDEVEPNSEFAAPQSIAMNVTIAGTIDNEDVDYFSVVLKKGERLSAEIEAIRLGTTLFDPYLAILDGNRFELAAADDAPVARQDAVASIVAPEDGAYYVQVRETSYGGNGACTYRLHVGAFPRPTAVYPAGGKKGETVEVQFLGDPTGPIAASADLPHEARREYGLFAVDAGGVAPSPNAFRLSDLGNALEQEPNDDLAQAAAIDVANAFNGVLSRAGDVDCFRFTAEQGQVFDIECYARRIRTGVDPVVNVYDALGRGVGGNDDARGPDSYLRFQAPEKGEYVVRVTDHLGRGQADFVYRVELTPPRPALTLEIPRVDRYSQYRQSVFVPRGGRYGTLVVGNRADFSGPIALDGNDLPPGVTMHSEPMADSLNMMPVVFEAQANAPLGGKLVDFTARPVDANVKTLGRYQNYADFVLGPPNQNLYYSGVVDRLPIVVVEELPFNLEIVEPKVPIVRDGTMNLKIRALRKEGFQQAIQVQLPFRPPGIGAPPGMTIPEGQVEADYVLNANGSAQLGKWPIYAIGSADVNGAAWACTQMAHLEIADPFLTLELQRASCEQAQPAQVLCKVAVVRPFEGEGQIQLVGLPPKTSCEPLKFNKETTELVFSIATAADAPVGSHKNLFGQLTLVQNGEPVVSTSGLTELQIDQPIAPPATSSAAPDPQTVAQAPAPPPAEKPLSRLEKLRLSAKQQQP